MCLNVGLPVYNQDNYVWSMVDVSIYIHTHVRKKEHVSIVQQPVSLRNVSLWRITFWLMAFRSCNVKLGGALLLCVASHHYEVMGLSINQQTRVYWSVELVITISGEYLEKSIILCFLFRAWQLWFLEWYQHHHQWISMDEVSRQLELRQASQMSSHEHV